MHKKFFSFLITPFFIILISLNTYASSETVYNWPPENIEVDTFAMVNSDTFSQSLSGLKNSIRSSASVGFRAFGMIASFGLISVIFRIVLDKLKLIQSSNRKEFNRKVNAFDFERNEQSIINDGVLKRKINRKVFAADIERNEDELIDDGVLKRMLNRKIASFDRKFNENAIIEDRVEEMEINHKARSEFRRRHPDVDIEERMYQKQLSYSRRRR